MIPDISKVLDSLCEYELAYCRTFYLPVRLSLGYSQSPISLPIGAYSKSLLKAFSKTVEDGSYAFVIVDAPNMRVEDVKGYFSKGQVSFQA